MPRFCAECGAQLPLGARFCVRCGSQVPAVESSADRVVADANAAANAGASVSAGAAANANVSAADSASAPTPDSPDSLDAGARGAEVAGAAASPAGMEAPTAPMPIGEAPTVPAPAVPLLPDPAPPTAGEPEVNDPPSMSVSDQFAAWPDAPGPAGYDAPPPVLSPTTPPVGLSVDAPETERKAPAWPLLVGVAVLLVVGLIWAFMALRGGGEASKSTTSATQSTGASSSSAPTSAANAEAQAAREAVGQVLDAGRGSRSTLVQGISAYCSKGDKTAGQAQMSDALQGRMAQLAKLNEVGDGPFKNVTGGLAARDKLKAALQASAGADQVYVQMATAGTVCQGSIELSQANTAASTAKKAFLDQWNPIMTGAKLQPLTNDDI